MISEMAQLVDEYIEVFGKKPAGILVSKDVHRQIIEDAMCMGKYEGIKFANPVAKRFTFWEIPLYFSGSPDTVLEALYHEEDLWSL